ncbi:hypothetical protein [Peribacillus simplex]|uniref:hypothetical protein n=1 Tax=Peribacillus simplex TaxID=1478 RepID=UPI0015C3AC20|nr:hypothetical protein [Peribacillus simplex]
MPIKLLDAWRSHSNSEMVYLTSSSGEYPSLATPVVTAISNAFPCRFSPLLPKAQP